MNLYGIKPGKELFFIGGPCVIESLDSSLIHADKIRKICDKLDIPFIFKSSFDKANRLSQGSFRGTGMDDGLAILETVKKKIGVKILTDVHCVNEINSVSSVADILQIPAFLCRQTDLVAKSAQTGLPINIKKGQFLSPWDMQYIADKAKSTGNDKIILTERGTTFGYGFLVNDMRAIPIMKGFGYPVLIDAGHSVQLPGKASGKSGGMRDMIPVIAKSGIAAGADGLFLETHISPDSAPSDGPNMIPLELLSKLLADLKKIYEVCN
ncbi:MAG: 3-deoxy-8-phosphooctulonate synthase [Planctomycetes bacterium]|nr:3-deoxy-8-phosphooctulonate synthase [Planctomycetota bacterium]